MIEKEAVVDDERAIIASVFVNRLRDPAFTPKLLQCDPTAGLRLPRASPELAVVRRLHGQDHARRRADPQNPYNTYKHEGLPPGPIANPGLRSIEAAMAPGDDALPLLRRPRRGPAHVLRDVRRPQSAIRERKP